MLNYKHLLAMSDDTGMLQFSQLSKPDPTSGYTLDDNARALMVALHMEEDAYLHSRRYLHFLANAQRRDGTWSNFLLDGIYYSRFDSEDSIGRAIMACAAASRSSWPDLAALGGRLIINKLTDLPAFTSPRAIAYSLVGLCNGNIPCPNAFLAQVVRRLADFLAGRYESTSGRRWRWFENYLTYCNGILPQALLCVYEFNGNEHCLRIGKKSLDFLNDTLFRPGYLSIVGNAGWYQRGGRIPLFDQQPVDAASMVFANWQAYKVLGSREYLELARLGKRWYEGENIHGLSLADKTSGGCYDALTQDGVNLNQGAEAVLSMLLSELLMEAANDSMPLFLGEGPVPQLDAGASC